MCAACVYACVVVCCICAVYVREIEWVYLDVDLLHPPLQAQLQLAVEQEDKFHQSYQSLDAGLGSMEETQEKG